ncbi:uncharacterized protein LOC143898871 [Temnothorax americanus]|uniref:uncharacterized protein LOC143898871 n=1 Tax=Temnothorax americanus TaxID=1964332 RepID=UPI0040680D98
MSKNEICGYASLLCSVVDKPLELWSKHVSYGGKVRRARDELLHGDRVIEITGPHDNAIPTSITIPAKAVDVLNIKLPILALVIKNLNLRFKLEIQIVDKEQYRRRFSFVTYNVERLPSISANVARIPLRLEECWNFLEINLQTLCREAYGMDYRALRRVTIYPNCHLRRVYLQDRHYNDDETPVEMCRAFFDMYLLKRGIGFIEKACQTEECYTGPLEQSDLNCFAKNDSVGTSPTKVELCKNARSTEKLKSSSPPDLNLYNSNTLKRNYVSLDGLNDAIKIRNRDVFTRQGEFFTKSLINDPVVEKKSEKSSTDVTGKAEQRCVVKMHKAGNSLLNIKINNHTLQPASSVELKRIAKSQFLKTHVSEILFKDNRFSKSPQKIQNVGDTYVNSRNCTLSNNDNNVQIGKDNSTDAEFRVSAVGSPSAFKLDLSESIKLNKITSNATDTRSNDISKHKYIRESEKNIANRLRSLVSIEENAEDITEDMFKHIQPVIEKDTKLDEIKS